MEVHFLRRNGDIKSGICSHSFVFLSDHSHDCYTRLWESKDSWPEKNAFKVQLPQIKRVGTLERKHVEETHKVETLQTQAD